jgi:cytochrome b subunit of formate dehydrogenase
MNQADIAENTTGLTLSNQQKYKRFDLIQRINHILLLVSFSILGITGIPQISPTSPLSRLILSAYGGIETTRLIHHIAAVGLMIATISHIISLFYRLYVLRRPLSMMPVADDFRHLYHDLLYYFGLRKQKAYYGRFNYAEKVEYLAVVWGTVIMGITGFMMWNPISIARWLPGQVIPAAKAAHGGEAILAVLSILLWHVYHVHLRQFNKSMFTGNLTREEMMHEHPANLASIDAGTAWIQPPEKIIQKRQRFFLPVAIVLSVFFVYQVYKFVTFEETAITTIPPGETVNVFVPLTPTPRPTLAPSPTPEIQEGVSPDSWQGNYDALFRNRCGSCHGITSVGGLTLATYQDALVGGDAGPAIVPGDPDASVLVAVQSAGNHPGQLTLDELDDVIEWILAGAPER